MTIFFLQGLSQYDVLNNFSNEIESEFKTNGFTTKKINLLKEHQLNAQKDDVVITFNHMGLQGKILDEINKLHLKTISLIVDHPIYHQERLLTTNIQSMLIGVADKSWIESIKLLNLNIENPIFFFPNGGMITLLQPPKRSSWLKRSDRILFLGGAPKKPYKTVDDMPNSLPKDIISSVRDIYISDETKNINDVFNVTIQSMGLNLSPLQTAMIYKSTCSKIIPEKGFNDRINAIIKISHENDIIIYGQSEWASVLRSNHIKNVTLRDPISITESLSVISSHKYMLNDFGYAYYGTHERNINSILAGTIPITRRNKYTDIIFDGALPQIETFDINRKKHEYDNMFFLFNKAINHSWAQRAKILMDKISSTS